MININQLNWFFFFYLLFRDIHLRLMSLVPLKMYRWLFLNGSPYLLTIYLMPNIYLFLGLSFIYRLNWKLFGSPDICFSSQSFGNFNNFFPRTIRRYFWWFRFNSHSPLGSGNDLKINRLFRHAHIHKHVLYIRIV